MFKVSLLVFPQLINVMVGVLESLETFLVEVFHLRRRMLAPGSLKIFTALMGPKTPTGGSKGSRCFLGHIPEVLKNLWGGS